MNKRGSAVGEIQCGGWMMFRRVTFGYFVAGAIGMEASVISYSQLFRQGNYQPVACESVIKLQHAPKNNPCLGFGFCREGKV